MAKKKTSGRRANRGRGGVGRAGAVVGAVTDGENLRRYGVPGGFVVVALLTGAGLWLGNRAIERRAGEALAPEHAIVRISWPVRAGGGDQESWLPADERDRLEEVALSSLGEDDPMSWRGLERVSRSLRGEGWFAGDPVVRRERDGGVRVDGAWRVPVGVVRWNGRDRLIAADGALLPMEYGRDESGQLVFIGVGRGPLTLEATGERAFDDAGLDAAIRLASLLDGDPAIRAQVAGITIVDPSLGGGLEIRTTRGGVIGWGTAPGEFGPGELDDGVKLDRMRIIHERTGWIDGGSARLELYGPIVEIPAGG